VLPSLCCSCTAFFWRWEQEALSRALGPENDGPKNSPFTRASWWIQLVECIAM
jgi:hypothetical protein